MTLASLALALTVSAPLQAASIDDSGIVTVQPADPHDPALVYAAQRLGKLASPTLVRDGTQPVSAEVPRFTVTLSWHPDYVPSIGPLYLACFEKSDGEPECISGPVAESDADDPAEATLTALAPHIVTFALDQAATAEPARMAAAAR